MKTAICTECVSRHSNKKPDGSLADRCFNCEIVVKMLEQCVIGLNMHTPINGRKRKLTITGYKIEKI